MHTKLVVSKAAAALLTLAACGSAFAVDSLLTVNAELTSACAVSEGATISFASFSTLALVDQTADSGSTFTVACSAGLLPKIYATGTRTIIKGAESLAFNLSMTSGAAADNLPATLANAEALPVSFVQDGTEKIVTLYARVAKANFGSLTAGTYANGSAVTVSVAY